MSTIVDFPSQGTIGANLKPKRYDLEIYQGDSFEAKLSFKQTNGSPTDLTGITLAVGFLKEAGGAAEVPMLGSHDGTGGVVTLTIDDTSALSGTYKWDLQFIQGSKKRTYLGGLANVTGDISP